MTNYFSHDVDAAKDPKCNALIAELGYAGYGLYWSLVEILHQQGGKIKKFPKLYEGLAYQLRVDVKQIEALLEALIHNCELLKEDENYIWSDRVIRNLEEQEMKKTKKQEAGRLGGYQSGKMRQEKKQKEALLQANEANEANKKKRKEIKRNNNTFVLSDEKARELNDVLATWNEVYRQKLKSFRAIEPNYVFWRATYEFDEIIQAIRSSPNTWLSGKPIETFFRRKNPNGENVDYISQCLNIPDKPEQEGILVVRQ